MVLGQKHGPLGHRHMTSSSSEHSLFIDVTLMTRFSIGVSASMHRIGEHVMEGRVVGATQRISLFIGARRKEGKTLRAAPKPDLTDGPQFGESREMFCVC